MIKEPETEGGRVMFWKYSNRGRLQGFQKGIPVDMNVFCGSEEQFRLLLGRTEKDTPAKEDGGDLNIPESVQSAPDMEGRLWGREEASELPVLPAAGDGIGDFIPRGYELYDQAELDFNEDRITDYIGVLRSAGETDRMQNTAWSCNLRGRERAENLS